MHSIGKQSDLLRRDAARSEWYSVLAMPASPYVYARRPLGGEHVALGAPGSGVEEGLNLLTFRSPFGIMPMGTNQLLLEA